MKKKIVIVLLFVLFFAGGAFHLHAEAQNLSLSQVVELLISLGIIPADKADAARAALKSASPVSSVQSSQISVIKTSATLGDAITNSAGYTTGYKFTMTATFENKGTSDMYLSNRGQGFDLTTYINSLVSTATYTLSADPSELPGDTSGVSFVIPHGGTRTITISGELSSQGQRGQVYFRVNSFIYGYSSKHPSELTLTSGLENLVVKATFQSSPTESQITVKSPNGKEVYPIDTSITFEWEENAAVKSPQLSVLDSSGSVVYSRALTGRDGKNSDVLDFRVLKVGGAYSLKICDTGSGICDTSDATFIVNGSTVTDRPTITVRSQNITETYSLASPNLPITFKAEVSNAKSSGSIHIYVVHAVGDVDTSSGAKLVSEENDINVNRGTPTSSNTLHAGDFSAGTYYVYAVWKDAAGNKATDYSDSYFVVESSSSTSLLQLSQTASSFISIDTLVRLIRFLKQQ